jgi:flagellar motor switch protein FliN/FliY
MVDESQYPSDHPEGRDSQTTAVSEIELPESPAVVVPGPGGQIEILLDALMTLSVTLGQMEIPVRDLLQLGPGSVLKLDRRKGEPIDIYLRGVKFATGHLVVVGEQLGVRIKEILSPQKPPAQA